ncbi:hypothetical protein L1987_40012 [Smallanthus sonchifolius]|uniref:Uncharacterized protein n=1 Tax=Smallanthus sonchifolius TaxID=185202 RepID=A0ACB9GSJ4_9ASTR|nr:hypothetical protein L1987_40012 [Smallanthus sonchifolius]
MVALGMSQSWDKKGYRPAYRHVRGGGGDGDPKSGLNSTTVIGLSDEQEARRWRIKTLANKEVETHHDQESGNGDGKGKQIMKPLPDVGLGEKVTGLEPTLESSKDQPIDSSSKLTKDESGGGTYRADSVKVKAEGDSIDDSDADLDS